MKLIWLPAALASLQAQIVFVTQDNPRAALDQGDAIERQVDLLADHPETGRKGRVRGTRERVVAGTPFIVAYRIRNSVVEILRVLHGAQQWPPRL